MYQVVELVPEPLLREVLEVTSDNHETEAGERDVAGEFHHRHGRHFRD